MLESSLKFDPDQTDLGQKRFLGNYSNYTVSAICLNRMKEVQANDVAGLIRSHKTKCELPAVDKNLQT